MPRKRKITLTDKQRRHLESIAIAGTRPAYPGLHMGVLQSLEKRGLVTADRGRIGIMFAPHNSIRWQLTPAARAMLGEWRS